MMPEISNSYCWGQTYTPHRVLDSLDNDGIIKGPRTISKSKIVGMVKDGDRIQQLVSGGRWLWGTAECTEDGFWFVGDGGQRWRIYDARWLKVQQLNLFDIVPMPDIEDFEEEELNVAIACGAFPELQIGDRIRILLAGTPLEHLTGALGTVEGGETFGIIPVLVDGVGSKLFHREQLDFVLDEAKTPQNEPCPSMQTAETIEASSNVTRLEEAFNPGQRVTHRTKWLGKSERSPVLALV